MIALADDDACLREILEFCAGRSGHAVVQFESGEALLEWARAGKRAVTAFLLDVDLPGWNGLESCRRLRALAGYAGIPVLFVTASGRADLEAQVRAAGGSGLVRKDGGMLEDVCRWLAGVGGAASSPLTDRFEAGRSAA